MEKIISKEDAIKELVKDHTQEEIDIIFAYHTTHPIVEGKHRLFWKQTIDYKNIEGMDPNSVAVRYYRGDMSQEEYMNYNREIGYSLYGYWEMFVFNNDFNKERYEKDMNQIKLENRDNIINTITNE